MKRKPRTTGDEAHGDPKAERAAVIEAFRGVANASPEQAERATREFLELLHTDHASLQTRSAAACLAMISLLIVTNLAFADHGLASVAAVAGMAAFCTVAIAGWARKASRATAELTAMLGHSTQPSVAAALIDILRAPNDLELARMAAASLETILPALRASDAALLGAVRMKYLMMRVVPEPAGDSGKSFRIAVIRSLQQLGDATAIPVLERLAQEGNSRLDSDPVAIAARETLPFVREHAALAGSSRELLRASAADPIQPDQLPRPAIEIAPHEELLHVNAQQTGPEP